MKYGPDYFEHLSKKRAPASAIGSASDPRAWPKSLERVGARGRPPAFIPALVVEHAAKLRDKGRGWLGIARELEETGNGKYSRNTLMRHVLKLPGQKGALEATPAPTRSRAAASSKKKARPRAARRRRR